jgi:hypothetical protein
LTGITHWRSKRDHSALLSLGLNFAMWVKA